MKTIFMFAALCVVLFSEGINGNIVGEVIDTVAATIEDARCRQKFDNPFSISLCKFVFAGSRKLEIEPATFIFIFIMIAFILISTIIKYLCYPRRKRIVVYTSRSQSYCI
ncbi:uncharacterized protein LOC116338810 [Contarinia nasturtii]|uniref:uncharacterized protein LOC116338810 n=1 Tax=Contarinia nasturtii TaxID=265458 RepID=UPI0012D41112|nr:uncharacterized protein LOC116338810 [Contarinia nasturtii]